MGVTKRITGEKKLGSTVEFLDTVAFIRYPTPTTWEADIVLEPSETEYSYRFLRSDGTYSPYTTVPLSPKKSTPNSHTAFNTLDKWGVRLDTQRLPDEDNSSYRDRLLDVFVHRGSSLHSGLINAICRDLDLTYNDQALIITRADNPSTGQPYFGIVIEITSTKVKLFANDFLVRDEEQTVRPVEKTVTPDKQVAGNLSVTTLDGEEVNWDYDEIKNLIYISDDIGGQDVLLDYTYREVVSRMSKTLSQLKTDLEAVQTPDGRSLIDVTIASGYGDKTAENLSRLPVTTLSEEHLDEAGTTVSGLPVRWSDMRLESVWDPEVHEIHRIWSGSLWNTKIDQAYRSLVNLGKSTWGTAVADESVWSHRDFPIHGGQHIDTIYDPPLGHWEDPSGNKYDKWQVDSQTVPSAKYRGVRKTDFKSGTGSKNDLKVVLGTSTSQKNIGSTDRDEVSETSADTTIPDGNSPTQGGIELP